VTTIRAAGADDRTRNPLRPTRLDEIIGQDDAKYLMRTAIRTAIERRRVLDHILLVGSSGTGKSTFSHAIANELDVDVFELEAPISFDMLAELRTTMQHGDLLKIEEIHQQAIMERRGRSGATQPEVLYSVMEDRVLQTPTGPLEFPRITVIGTTTDEGMLPDAFVNRFALRPRLRPYTVLQMSEIIASNADTLRVRLDADGLLVFAKACRGVPREANNLVKNAAALFGPNDHVDRRRALEVLAINGVTEDGLTTDMQGMLTFLLTRARRKAGDGEIRYQASVNTIATALGKSRDSKSIALRVEPFLIEKGYVQVGHGGRLLTADGIRRAQLLVAAG
jgi:Holliday junction DNA helicase RuvB